MNEDNKIATINNIRNISSSDTNLMNIIEEIKANLKDGNENRAVPYRAIKDIELLEAKGTYQDNQLVKLSDISFNSAPTPEDPEPEEPTTYEYDIPVYINNIIIQDGINPNTITVEFIQNDKSIAEIKVPDTFIEFNDSKTTNKSISYTSPNFTTDIIINFNSPSFVNNYNIECGCNGISKQSTISSSGGGQTEIKLENVLLSNNKNNTINITIAAAS